MTTPATGGQKRQLVIAGNMQQFLHYVRTQNLPPTEAKFIDTPARLQGWDQSRIEVVAIGTYDRRRDWPEMVATLRATQLEYRVVRL